MPRILPSAAAVPPRVPDFTPVPVRARHDGWTAERQLLFMRALAATLCVDRAAREAGMSREGAYRLRRRKGAESFAAAWDSILAARPRGMTSLDLQWHRMIRSDLKRAAAPPPPVAAPSRAALPPQALPPQGAPPPQRAPELLAYLRRRAGAPGRSQ